MKFCQARLSPPLIGQIVAEASLDTPEEYLRDVYDEYVERRKCLIDGLNRIPGVYSPIPMGAFYTVAKLPVDDAEKFCRWCLAEFEYEGETVMMAPAAGFYTTPGAGINQVRIAYVLKKKDLERALFVLRKALEAYPGRVDDEERNGKEVKRKFLRPYGSKRAKLERSLRLEVKWTNVLRLHHDQEYCPFNSL